MKNEKLVIIIIVNWNGIEDTKECLESLMKIDYKNYQIIVIDNGSVNNEAELLKKEYQDKIQVIRLAQNMGFTGGNNYGLAIAERYCPNYFLLLNNDTTVDKNFLKNLIDYVKDDAKIGLATPIIYSYRNKNEILFSGGYFNWKFARTIHLRKKISETIESEFITGCSLLMSFDLYKEIGKLDDTFFAYFEDAAYSLLSIKKNYKNVCVPFSRVYHKDSATTGKQTPLHTFFLSRNRILFVNNYMPLYYKIYFSIYNFFKLFLVMIYLTSTMQFVRLRAYFKGYVYGNLGKGGVPQI